MKNRFYSAFTATVCAFLLILGCSSGVQAKKFEGVEAVKAKYTGDYFGKKLPKRGFNYYAIAEDVYFVHNAFENMAFVVTDDGVVVYDPGNSHHGKKDPEISQHALVAIREVTDKPITHVIYSHHHRDHAQGAHWFLPKNTGAKKKPIYVAHKRVGYFLKLANDPKRPLPDLTWEGPHDMEIGGVKFEFRNFERNWHSTQDTFIYLPQKKVLLICDSFHQESAPWHRFGESGDPMFAFQWPQIILDTYDFNFAVTGHERIIATRAHLEVHRDYVNDIQRITWEMVKDPIFQTQVKHARGRFGEGYIHPFYKEVWKIAADHCASKLVPLYAGKLRNIELNAKENCMTTFARLIILEP